MSKRARMASQTTLIDRKSCPDAWPMDLWKLVASFCSWRSIFVLRSVAKRFLVLPIYACPAQDITKILYRWGPQQDIAFIHRVRTEMFPNLPSALQSELDHRYRHAPNRRIPIPASMTDMQHFSKAVACKPLRISLDLLEPQFHQKLKDIFLELLVRDTASLIDAFKREAHVFRTLVLRQPAFGHAPGMEERWRRCLFRTAFPTVDRFEVRQLRRWYSYFKRRVPDWHFPHCREWHIENPRLDHFRWFWKQWINGPKRAFPKLRTLRFTGLGYGSSTVCNLLRIVRHQRPRLPTFEVVDLRLDQRLSEYQSIKLWECLWKSTESILLRLSNSQQFFRFPLQALPGAPGCLELAVALQWHQYQLWTHIPEYWVELAKQLATTQRLNLRFTLPTPKSHADEAIICSIWQAIRPVWQPALKLTQTQFFCCEWGQGLGSLPAVSTTSVHANRRETKSYQYSTKLYDEYGFVLPRPFLDRVMTRKHGLVVNLCQI